MKNLLKKLVLIVTAMTLGLGTMFGLAACGNDDTIIVYTESGFAPFEYVKDGKIVGVDVDIMNKVGKKLGKKVVFEDVSFDIIIDSVAAGKLCKVGAAGISVNDERKKKVDFSTEYYTAKLYVIYKAADESKYVSDTTDNVKGVYWDSLAGKNIAVQGGTTADAFVGDEIKNGTLTGTDAKCTPFSALSTATADVNAGNCDVLIIDELPAQKLVEKNSALKCVPLYYKGEDGKADNAATDVYAICVTKGETELLKAINEVLAELGQSGIEELVQTHLGVK